MAEEKLLAFLREPGASAPALIESFGGIPGFFAVITGADVSGDVALRTLNKAFASAEGLAFFAF